jgi:rhodanese-related sulfurtransferase
MKFSARYRNRSIDASASAGFRPFFFTFAWYEMTPRKFLLAISMGALLLSIQWNASAAALGVPLEAARDALEKSSAVVVDIREPNEYASGVAKGALLIPMSQLGRRLGELPKQPFLVICNTQNRSSMIVEKLHAAGYTHASYVKGGMSLWASRGWPMVKP